ncbi:MAG: heavy metal translocating P-type ATPase, partial [Kiritimatiellia bacterium]
MNTPDPTRPLEDNCLGIAARAASNAPGITPTEVDPVLKTLKVDLDPGKATGQDLEKFLTIVQPELKHRFERCTMRLSGRACEGCALKYEHRAENIPGIRHATASFIGGTMSVTYDGETLPADQVMDRVRETGAPVKPLAPQTPGPQSWLGGIIEGRGLEIASVVAGFAAMMAGWIGGQTGMAPGLHHAFYVLAYFLLGWMGVVAGFQSLRGGMVDVDLLMILAALGAAFVDRPFEGAMLLFLFSLSNTLQDLAVDRTRKAIHALMKLRPDNALVRRGDHLVTLPIGELQVGDHVVVRPGENIPLDGVISEGESALDESSLTGESMPVTKRHGDPVFAGTTNQSGGLEVVVTKLAKDSAIARLIRMVEDAQSEKAKTQRFLEKAEQGYALGVILLTAGLILVPWLVFKGEFNSVFYRAMTVMVVASPCALVISTPATILSAIGGAARRGVLFKGGAYLERAASIRVVAIDKTGTLTE